jgi:hypothetical protein
MTKTPAYLKKSVNYERKKFYNTELDMERFGREKHYSLFFLFVGDKSSKLILTSGGNVIKLFSP